MTDVTANFSLPYPDGSDEPCDFAEQWCDFTEALDEVFDRFQSTLDRTVPMIPMAVLSLSEPLTTGDFTNITYDTLIIDSAGWTAVDLDPTLISPTMAAVMAFSVSAIFTQVQAPGMFILDPVDSLGLITEPALPFANQLDMNSCPVAIPLESLLFSPGTWTPGLSGIRNNVSVSGAFTTLQLRESIYTIYWHADGGTV